MKPPKKKIVKLKRIDDIADKFGAEYVRYRDEEKEAVKYKNKLADDIKATAEESGEQVRNMRLMVGKKFAVGYYLRTIGSKVDIDKAKKILPKDIFDACMVKFLDVDKLVSFVESGKVSRKGFKQLVILGKPTKYVVVKTKAELDKELEKDEEAEQSDQTTV